MQKSKQNAYFPELDFIKALAIIMVILFHFYGQLAGWHMNITSSEWFMSYFQEINPAKIFYFVEAYFYLGVNLFVIASGFGLYLSHLKSGKTFSWNDFLKKRVWRILPAAFLSIIFVFLFKGFVLGDWPMQHLEKNAFPFLFGLNLFSDNWFFPPINGETWFLGLIIQLYLLFPFLVRLLEKVGTKRFLIIIFLISSAFRLAHYFFLHQFVNSLGYGFSLGRLFEFGFGMVLAKNISAGQSLNRLWLLPLTLFWGYFYSFTYPFTDALLGVSLFTLLYFIGEKLLKQESASANQPLNRISKFLSNESYMIFLIHHPIIWAFEKYNPPASTSIKTLNLVLTFICSILISVLLNKLLIKLNPPPQQITKIKLA